MVLVMACRGWNSGIGNATTLQAGHGLWARRFSFLWLQAWDFLPAISLRYGRRRAALFKLWRAGAAGDLPIRKPACL